MGFNIYFCTIIIMYCLYFYHKPPDFGHSSDRNMLVKNNNIWLNIYNIYHTPSIN